MAQETLVAWQNMLQKIGVANFGCPMPAPTKDIRGRIKFGRRSCEAQDGGTGVQFTGTANSPARQNSKLFLLITA